MKDQPDHNAPQIRPSEALGRPLRQDPVPELGESTFALAMAFIDRGEPEKAKEVLDYAREEARVVHDMYVNWAWTFFTYVARTQGEAAVERAMRFVMESYYKPRYTKVMQAPVKEQLDLCVEGMRGHFFGPGRTGEVDVTEDELKYTLIYKPCGTGGVARQRIADEKEMSPQLFGVTEEPRDWSWGQAGVGYYCAHCAMVNEILSIESFGHPMRITHYDPDPHKPCIWTIYKNPADIPAEFYERVGKAAPPGARRRDERDEPTFPAPEGGEQGE